MIYADKQPGRDFTILNFTDPQLHPDDYESGNAMFQCTDNTIKRAVEEVSPDYITITGDFSYAECYHVYGYYRELFDSIGIPWSVVWGNHDNQGGPEPIEKAVNIFSESPLFRYESGDPALGNGNYVIAIRENGRIVSSVIMMDTHDRMDLDGSEEWAKLIPEQLVWYREQVKMLRELGCDNSVLMMHIPIYAYRTASEQAFLDEDCKIWKPEFADCVGIQLEGIASYPEDEGAMDLIEELGHTKCVLCGHDHANNTIIPHRGIWLAYSLKTGPGCYWDKNLNGGTVLRFSDKGFCDIHHHDVIPDPQI